MTTPLHKPPFYFLLFLLMAAIAFAAQPAIIALQGKLTNATTGAIINSASIRVNISDAAGATVWNETFASGVSNGFFDLLLGTDASNPLNLTFGQNYNISIYAGSSAAQIGGTYRFQSGAGQISPSNLSAGNFSSPGNFSFGSSLFVDKTNSNVGIGTTTPNRKLHVIGDANISTNLFIGGNLTFGNSSDYAEMFESDAKLEKGDVACLDAQKKISKCKVRADPSVIGVVSTNPSIIGRTGFANSYPIGLIGVVPTKVKGPVNLFEMLTTSSTPGYAEKATINDFGAIIGKAIEPCRQEECVIDVVVGLR